MGEPAIENHTPFAVEVLFVTDEEARPCIVPVIKATYHISGSGGLSLAEAQIPVNFAGEFWGDPDRSSYKYEPETAFAKVATDVVLIGHAHAPRAGTRELDVVLHVGKLQKTVHVLGDRTWVQGLSGKSITAPRPFDRIPLTYERAFGGFDTSTPGKDSERPSFEPRNPVGVGFRGKHGRFEDGLPLPNLEDPRKPIKSFGDAPAPVGFGFVSPHWQPRAGFAGTYDERWSRERMPRLPLDFNRKFFSAAPADQVIAGYLRGDEDIVVVNASSTGRISFRLPAVSAPRCVADVVDHDDQSVETKLDTVIINTDEDVVLLLWRPDTPMHGGPHDLRSLDVSAADVPGWGHHQQEVSL
jgi:hypothetical protein